MKRLARWPASFFVLVARYAAFAIIPPVADSICRRSLKHRATCDAICPTLPFSVAGPRTKCRRFRKHGATCDAICPTLPFSVAGPRTKCRRFRKHGATCDAICPTLPFSVAGPRTKCRRSLKHRATCDAICPTLPFSVAGPRTKCRRFRKHGATCDAICPILPFSVAGPGVFRGPATQVGKWRRYGFLLGRGQRSLPCGEKWRSAALCMSMRQGKRPKRGKTLPR